MKNTNVNGIIANVKQRKYSLLKSLICVHLEKIHRRVFDYLYHQNHKITKVDKITLFYYKTIKKLLPEFRSYLKYWKPVIDRAYSQKRIDNKTFYVYSKLKNINTDRYADYFNYAA